VRFVRKLLLKCEERVRNGHRPRSCSVGGSESSETWDNGISLHRQPCNIGDLRASEQKMHFGLGG
jgi:hypothetical protein